MQTLSVLLFFFQNYLTKFHQASVITKLSLVIYLTFHWLAVSYSVLNPLIYCFMSEDFRHDLKSIFCTNRWLSFNSFTRRNQQTEGVSMENVSASFKQNSLDCPTNDVNQNNNKHDNNIEIRDGIENGRQSDTKRQLMHAAESVNMEISNLATEPTKLEKVNVNSALTIDIEQPSDKHFESVQPWTTAHADVTRYPAKMGAFITSTVSHNPTSGRMIITSLIETHNQPEEPSDLV